MLELFKYGFDRTPLNVWKNIFENKLKGFHAQNLQKDIRECVLTIK